MSGALTPDEYETHPDTIAERVAAQHTRELADKDAAIARLTRELEMLRVKEPIVRQLRERVDKAERELEEARGANGSERAAGLAIVKGLAILNREDQDALRQRAEQAEAQRDEALKDAEVLRGDIVALLEGVEYFESHEGIGCGLDDEIRERAKAIRQGRGE